MITYRAMFLFADGGVHAEVLDFPGAMTAARRWKKLVGCWPVPWWTWPRPSILGQPLPKPDPVCSDPEADLEEPIHLLLSSCYRYAIVPQDG